MIAEERIASLERSSRRWRTACVLGMLAAGGIAAFGANRAENVPYCIEARRLAIVDEEVEVQVVLNAADQQAARTLLTERGPPFLGRAEASRT